MYFIGFDIGSSSVKAALIRSATGERIGLITQPETEMEMIALHNGWAEQPPDLWWEHVCTATKKLLSEHSVSPEVITGIGISYQMHGLVLVDKEGNPLRNAIIWCDSRAVAIGQKAFDELGHDTCAKSLLNSPSNFTASKLRWVKENEPEIFERIHKFMLPGDYIAYKLSGIINSTIPGLSEAILWDFKTNQVSDGLLEYYGLHPGLLPDLVPTFGMQSKVSARGSVQSGLAEGTPILYRAGDQPNNALSLNVLQAGDIAATGGTSGVFYAVTDHLSVKESARVNNFAHVNYHPDHPRIGKLLCINGAGIQYRWLLNNLKVSSYEEMNRLADSIPVGSDGITILPFGNGAERMLNNLDPGTHISYINLNNHTTAHLCRAALEGIAFSFAYGMEILKSDGIQARVIRAGNDNLFRSAIFSETIATLIDQEIEIYDTTGAIGAARACVLQGGDFIAFEKQLKTNDYIKSYSPAPNKEAYRKAYSKWKKELESKL